MARFSFGPESNANYRGVQPYQAGRPTPMGYRGGPAPAIPEPQIGRSNAPLDPQQIIAQILSNNKSRGEIGGGNGSSSNNSSSSRTGVSGSRIIKTNNNNNNEHCDITIQSEYENVRAPMMLPPARKAGTEAGGGGDAASEAATGKSQRRLGRQKSRYTSGK